MSPKNRVKNEEWLIVSCYGFGKPGFTKASCPTCSPPLKKEAAEFRAIRLQTLSIDESQSTLVGVKINGINGFVCADTGASHTIASEMLHRLLREWETDWEYLRLLWK